MNNTHAAFLEWIWDMGYGPHTSSNNEVLRIESDALIYHLQVVPITSEEIHSIRL